MDDETYYYARAEAELDMAQRASNTAAVKAHYDLANHYLERVYPPAVDDPETKGG